MKEVFEEDESGESSTDSDKNLTYNFTTPADRV